MTEFRASAWPHAVLFDLDGTLIDSAPDLAAAANLVLARDGLGPLPVSAVRSMIGHGVRALIDHAYRACAHPIEGAALDSAEATMMACYGTHMTVNTTLKPDAIGALDAVRTRGAALGVVTNKPAGFTQAILDHFAITGQFDVIIGGDFGLAPKPAPDGLLAALDQLSLTPADAMMVGDSITDIRAASAAGICCVAVEGGYSTTSASALGAHHVIPSLAALPALLAMSS